MKHSYEISCDGLLLRQIAREDIELLRIWRNDKFTTRFLHPIGEITPQMQEKWYETYLNNDNEIAFVIEEKSQINAVIGSIALYDFVGTRAEFGKFMIGDDRAHGKGIGRKSLIMLLKFGFEELNLSRIVAEVHTDNTAAYTNYIRVGCKVIGVKPSCVGGSEYILEIVKNDIEANDYYNDILIA